jgi:hypothetical protein
VRKTQPLALPRAFESTGEVHPWLKRFKETRYPKWRLTRADSLHDMSKLGFFLHALGRLDEALEVVRFPAERVQFAGDYNIWTWVAISACQSYYLLQALDRREESERFAERLSQFPSPRAKSPETMAEDLAEWSEILAKVEQDDYHTALVSG